MSIKKQLQKLTMFVQGEHTSYKRHNSELEAENKLEMEKRIAADYFKNNLINDPTLRVTDLLEKHPQISTAVDVGSGAGWGSASLSKLVTKVIAIEPSQAGIDIAKQIYPTDQYPNITWVNGFAESILPTLKLDAPTLFLTGCVLSHIRDKEVVKICTEITKSAPTGSVLSFAECWGDKEWHQLMWHVRTKDWWQDQLPGWELNFHGPVVPEKDEYKGTYHKGIWGVKTG